MTAEKIFIEWLNTQDYWRKKFYNAYLCNNLEKFYIANKYKIKDY